MAALQQEADQLRVQLAASLQLLAAALQQQQQ
jgi:hypothetical protein